jgi:hypothetical protein
MPQRGCSRSLGRPALRSCSSTEQEPGHRGESVSDGRPIACASSSFVRLLGSGAFVACGPTRAREWVRLGSPVAVARRGVGLASRLCAAPRLAADISTRERVRLGAPRRAGYARRALVEAPRARGGRWWERNAVGLVDPASPPRAGGSAVGVRPCGRSGTALGGGRFVSWSCGGQVALGPALSHLSAEPRAGRSAPFFSVSKKRGGERHDNRERATGRGGTGDRRGTSGRGDPRGAGGRGERRGTSLKAA